MTLKELFVPTMFVGFQKDLEGDVPHIVEQLTGLHVGEHYQSIVTLLFCLVLFYGADFLYKQIAKTVEGSRLRAQLDGLVKEVAALCRVEEDHVRETLAARYEKKRFGNLIHSAIDFFAAHEGVDIELHAQDMDRARQGWAGVIQSLSDRRLRMQVYPPIKPEEIYTRTKIRGDVIVVSRRAPDGSMEPYMFHLIRLRD